MVIQHLTLQQISKSEPTDFPHCPNTQPVPNHTPLQRPAYKGIPLLKGKFASRIRCIWPHIDAYVPLLVHQ